MKFRSVLFVPGHEEKKIKKAYTLKILKKYQKNFLIMN